MKSSTSDETSRPRQEYAGQTTDGSADNRCGHVVTDTPTTDIGGVCCWRPVWEDRDRCIWHTDETAKSAQELAEYPLEDGERLDGAVLRGVSLRDVTWLAGCSLVGTDFTGAILDGADLSEANLTRAKFNDTNLYQVKFDRATLKEASFRDADIRGTSFADARLYQAFFADTRADRSTDFGERIVYEGAVEEADTETALDENLSSATWTYREIRRLFESNANPERAREHYLKERDLRRRAAWKVGNYHDALVREGSRWVMQYGISPWRVILTSLMLIVVCAVLYPLTGGIQVTRAETVISYSLDNPAAVPAWGVVNVFFKSLYFSAVTFATIGYGDIRPVSIWARMLAATEGLLGALLTALLVYVLAQRVR